MITLNKTSNHLDNIAISELEAYLNDLDTSHPDAHVALATVLLSWTNANQLSDGLLASVLNQISFDQTLEPILESSIFFMEMLVDENDDEMYPSLETILDAYSNIDGDPEFTGADLELPDIDFEDSVPQPAAPLTNTASLSAIMAVHDANEDNNLSHEVSSAVLTAVEHIAPVQTPSAAATSDTPIDEPSDSTLASSFIEDCAFAKGIAVISADDWRKSKNNRSTPVIVKNFDFRTINRPDLGKASFMLIAPKANQDVRIELRSQTVSGSAGDKLPVLVHKLHSLQQSREYGQTVVGVVGDTSFFSKYSLDLARQVAANSGLVIYAEGDSPVNNALSTVMDNVLSKYQAPTPVSPTNTPAP